MFTGPHSLLAPLHAVPPAGPLLAAARLTAPLLARLLAVALLAAPLLAQQPAAPATPADALGATDILDAVDLRYADVRTYHDTARMLRRHVLADGRVLEMQRELELSFARAPADAPPVRERDGARAPHRWRYVERHYEEWGRAVPLILWCDGREARQWYSGLDPEGFRVVDPGLLHDDEQALPLVLALGWHLGREHPFALADRTERLPDAELAGTPCHRVRLAWERGHERTLTLWIAAGDATLRRLEAATVTEHGAVERRVDYAPVLDAPLPPEALAFDPPDPVLGVPGGRAAALAPLFAVGVVALALGAWGLARRRPTLLLGPLALLPALTLAALYVVEALVTIARVPDGLAAAGDRLLFSAGGVLLLGLAMAWLSVREWAGSGLPREALRAAVERVVAARGGAAEWTALGRRREGTAVPGSGLRLGLRTEPLMGGALRARGRGSWAERRALRRELEAALTDAGVRAGPQLALVGLLLAGVAFATGVLLGTL